MLTIPEVLSDSALGVVVYPDDEDPDVFYALPSRARLRVEAGLPKFRGLFWTDQADGETGAVAGLRGGQLNFDVNLGFTPDERDRILAQLKSSGIPARNRARMERELREQRRREARALGEDPDAVAVSLPEPGELTLGHIRFTKGTVKLLEKSDNGADFIQWTSAGGPPALVGDNTAAIAVRFGSEGAAVWYRALQQDTAALGIRYELEFEARLPSLQVHIWAASHQDLDIERQVTRTTHNIDQGCSDADVQHIDVKSIAETLEEHSLIHIEITKGSAKISDEHVAQLRTVAVDLMTQRIKEVIASRIHGLTEEQRRSSLVELIKEEITSFAEMRFTQRDVVSWQANPQGTLTEFLSNVQFDDVVSLVDLSDPIVDTLSVKVSVSASWTSDPKITQVKVVVTYPRARPDDRVQWHSFDENNTGTELHWRRQAGSAQVDWSAEVYVQGFADPVVLPGGRVDGDILIEVPAIGSLQMLVRAAPGIFDQKRGAGAITGIECRYRYGTPGAPGSIDDSVVLRADKANGEDVYHRIGTVIDGPVIVTPTYFRDAFPAIEGDPIRVWLHSGVKGRAEIVSPWKDVLRVPCSVEPGFGKKGLFQVDVELQYADTDADFFSDTTVSLGGEDAEIDDWKSIGKLVQLDKTKQRFRYRYKLVTDNQVLQSPWGEAEGDQELLLPVLDVTVRANRAGIGETYEYVVLELEYKDTARGFTARTDFILEGNDVTPTWFVPRLDATHSEYSYTATFYPISDDDPITIEGTGSGPLLRIRAPNTEGE